MDKELFAVKIVKTRDVEIIRSVIKEFKHLQMLDHKNIVKLIELYIDFRTNKIHLVMELVQFREMLDILKDRRKYTGTMQH